MPTSLDRTTIRATVDALVARLKTDASADPPTAAKPFRSVQVGALGVEEAVRPFVSVALLSVVPAGVASGDKFFAVSMSIRAVTDVMGSEPLAKLLDLIGALEDVFDEAAAGGIIEGAEGFDDREWKIEYPTASAGARVAVAAATQSFVVKVERGQNRVAAP